MSSLLMMVCVGFLQILAPAPMHGQTGPEGEISPYAFVPGDIGAFFTFDIQRFLELKEVKHASGVWGELFQEFADNPEYLKFKDISGIDPIRDIHSLTLVAFDSISSRRDDMAVIFYVAKNRGDLADSFGSIHSLQKIPGFREYEDIPLFQLELEEDDPPVYLALPGGSHVVVGYKHEVKRILAVFRGERPNILTQKNIDILSGSPGKSPIFQCVAFVTEELNVALKKMKSPLDLQGTSAIQLSLDPDFLAFRLFISDSAEITRIASFWTGIKTIMSAVNPSTSQEKSLAELASILEILSTPSGLTLRLPSGQTIPKLEAAIAHELRMNWAIAKADATIYNLQIIADAIEIYLLTHPSLPSCLSLEELKKNAPGIFSNYDCDLPERDGWDNAILFRCSGTSYAIASTGSDKQFGGWDQPAGDYIVQNPEDFKKDYIFSNGLFSVKPEFGK